MISPKQGEYLLTEQTSQTSSTFCIMPWRAVNINARGFYTPCCTSDYKIVHSNDVTIQEAWNHPTYKAIRQAMLNNQWHEACRECEIREKDSFLSQTNYISARKNFSRDPLFKDGFKDVVPIDSPPLELAEIEIDFSNKCNLQCNMCGSHNSTAWVEDEKALGVFDESNFVLRKPTSEKQYAEYLKFLENVKVLRFKGGEPFMVPEPLRILKDLIRLGKTNKTIHFVSNATIVKPEIFSILNQFEWVDFEVSLDATGSYYQYMRGGLKYPFSHLDNQLKMIRESLDPDRSQLTVNTVYQNLNCFNLLDFTKWFHQFAQESKVRLSLIRSVLTGPEIYRVSNMPSELKDLAMEQVRQTREFLNTHPKPEMFGTWERSIEVLKDLENAIQQDFDEDLWKEFKDWTKKLDLQKKMPISQFVPEFKPYFREKTSMPHFKRIKDQTMTLFFIIGKDSDKILTDENLKVFAGQLQKNGLNNRDLFISLSFKDRFNKAIYSKIHNAFLSRNPTIDIGVEISRWGLLRLQLPEDVRTTLVLRDVPRILMGLLWYKLGRRKGMSTVMDYVPSDSIDEKIDYYNKVHKKHPQLEIVLHPDENEPVSASNQSLMETIRSEGYFAPRHNYESNKPERMRINYKYADIDLSPREIKIKDLNHFKGYHCKAGQEHMVIGSDGKVQPSTCGHLPSLSSKIGEDFVVPDYFVCPANSCLKNDDLLISKLDLGL